MFADLEASKMNYAIASHMEPLDVAATAVEVKVAGFRTKLSYLKWHAVLYELIALAETFTGLALFVMDDEENPVENFDEIPDEGFTKGKWRYFWFFLFRFLEPTAQQIASLLARCTKNSVDDLLVQIALEVGESCTFMFFAGMTPLSVTIFSVFCVVQCAILFC